MPSSNQKGERSVPTAPGKPLEDRLDSWKEIAAYLGRDVTTVQRWEKREGMPVHRHLHDRKGSVYASRTELDEWARSRNIDPQDTLARLDRAPRSLYTRRFLFVVAAVNVALAVAIAAWLQRSEFFWKSPIAGAHLQTITDWDGVEQAAALSRDGRFLAFLSDRDGKVDVWLTDIGTGVFHNLTKGIVAELVNPSVRTLGFSPDGSLVTFWVRRPGRGSDPDISIWAIPTLGGQPRPYLEGAAEYDWSRDESRLAYHTPGPGDPLFVTDRRPKPDAKPIFTAPVGLHSHFPVWGPDQHFIYFVQGSLPDKLDIWRIAASGGTPERITRHNSKVTHPILLDPKTMMYLATDPDGSGPWLFSMDIGRRIPHRLSSGLDRYTSLAASANGRRLAVTLADPKRTLWRLGLNTSDKDASPLTPISLTSGTGYSPRLGPNYLLYVSATASTDTIWKLDEKGATELWRGEQARILCAPSISSDGVNVAFNTAERGREFLYVMRSDGTNVRVIADSLDLEGDPAWAPDGRSITVAAREHGMPHLFRVPLDGGKPEPLVSEHSSDPAWSPDGEFVLFSGPDVGTTFSVKAARTDGHPRPLPKLNLTRGARHIALMQGGRSIVVLRGSIEHKDLWRIDLESGREQQLTHLPSDFDVRNFDVSPDGQHVVLERIQDRSDLMLIDFPKR